ncbi:Putative sugar phosphate isomerase YwlF [Peribacillus simplex]|uniref:ribose 5-phosphate isomerase B n=1 Tax=Peribacillus simplex TaxID=1478 RepID=UPI001D1C7215|nr:ribose 5-phosphate isomerase B [Peribacillus simplex]CAH0317080.1 Putative sugar phosphate isomerase YwlF [Peribacillus simplex]
MRIAIGCDHGGFQLKESVKKHLKLNEFEVIDFGTNSRESVHFPNYALKVGISVKQGESELGVLCCGTGIGMSIAANKIKGIRASVVNDCFSAKATKEHNGSNVLCLGERVLGEGLALSIVDTWIKAEFQGGRHEERLNQVKNLEENYARGK